jgi:NAD-dependent deacetylase
MVGSFSFWARATLNGVAQTVFCDTPLAGALTLTALALISPWSAVGGLLGAALGAAAALHLRGWKRFEIELGLAGVNLSILGAFLAYSTTSGGLPPALAAMAALACIAIEQACRPPLAKIGLPVLSFPATATALLTTMAVVAMGRAVASAPPDLPLGEPGVYLSLGLFIAAMATKSGFATLLTVVLSASAALGSGLALGTGLIGPASLWAFTVAPAAFGIHAVFLAESRLGAVAGLACASVAAAIWALWLAIGVDTVLAPVLVPFILATWIVMAAVRRIAGPAVFDPHVWQAVAAIREARSTSRPVVALTGAGISTASGIPDYVSGKWLDDGVPVSTYSYDRFLASPRCRRLYWDACHRFRQVVRRARPNAGHHALAAMERAGWLDTIITQNVDRLHAEAGRREVIELHGRIDRVRCTSCGASSDWPPAAVWRKYDLRCNGCGELLKPAVIAMGENVPAAMWEKAAGAVKNCGVLIVTGSQMAVSSAADLLATAREYGARVVCVNLGPPVCALQPGDVLVEDRAEEALPAIAKLLGSYPVHARGA